MCAYIFATHSDRNLQCFSNIVCWPYISWKRIFQFHHFVQQISQFFRFHCIGDNIHLHLSILDIHSVLLLLNAFYSVNGDEPDASCPRPQYHVLTAVGHADVSRLVCPEVSACHCHVSVSCLSYNMQRYAILLQLSKLLTLFRNTQKISW